MEYQNTVAELFDLQKYAIKLGLDNIRALMQGLGNPHKNYAVIHIAGTNGKGSVAFFTAAVLQSMGLKTGLFTSPHLRDFRERVRVNGKIIEKNEVIDFWQNIKDEVIKRKATFFDTTTAMGLDYFSRSKVDVAVVETGLGGRLDSTNIVDSEIAVITPIDFDHQKQLGNSLAEIAYEKAGIIKEKSAVFSAKQRPDALRVLKSVKEHEFFYFPDYIRVTVNSATLDKTEFDIHDKLHKAVLKRIETKQAGSYQAENIALAYFTARYFLVQKGIGFNKKLFRQCIANSLWPGRLEKISSKPNIIFDVSHNPAGIKTTLNHLLSKTDKNNLHILLGLVEDKSYNEITAFISGKCRIVYVTEPDTHRRLDGRILLDSLKKNGQETKLIKKPQEALNYAKLQLKQKDTLLVIGSHYLIGALLTENKNN